MSRLHRGQGEHSPPHLGQRAHPTEKPGQRLPRGRMEEDEGNGHTPQEATCALSCSSQRHPSLSCECTGLPGDPMREGRGPGVLIERATRASYRNSLFPFLKKNSGGGRGCRKEFRTSEWGVLEQTGRPGTESGQLLGKAAHTHDDQRDSELQTGRRIPSCRGQEAGFLGKEPQLASEAHCPRRPQALPAALCLSAPFKATGQVPGTVRRSQRPPR